MWDEAVHALVAKNMASDPFHPMLHKEQGLDLYPFDWTRNHVWLHKQPFFLWMMALSLKVGGLSVLALRLPSAVFTTMLVFFTYGIGRSLHDRRTAFVAAMLMTWSHWIMRVIIGAVPTDHNDAIFISLVGGSLWAWYAGRSDPRPRWALAAGAMAGLAVLTKWLPGMLVFAGWGAVAMALVLLRGSGRHEWKRMGLALGTALMIILPWQVHAWSSHPAEMAFEQEYNMRHLHEALEGHDGDQFFHLAALSDHLAPIPLWCVIIAFGISVLAVSRWEIKLHLLVTVLLTQLFFMWSATKMLNYTLMLLPLFMIGIAHIIARLSLWPGLGGWSAVVFTALVVGTTFAVARMERLQLFHTEQAAQDPYHAWYRQWRLHNLEAEQHLADRLRGQRCIIFNVLYPSNLSYTFFHGQEAVYGLPRTEQARQLTDLGYTVLVVDPPDDLPGDLLEHVTVLEMGVHGFRAD